jgi:hypothetical protein
VKRLIRRPLALVVALGATLLVGGIAWAAIPDSSGAINACYTNSNGKLRAVDSAADCNGGESAIALGGPTIGYSTSRPDLVPIDNTTSTLASLDLPVGKYLVHGKLDIVTVSSENTFVACNLTVAGTAGFSDASWHRIQNDGGPGHGEAIALQTPLTLTSAGGVVLTCVAPESSSPSPAIARYVQLDAIRLDGLVIQ